MRLDYNLTRLPAKTRTWLDKLARAKPAPVTTLTAPTRKMTPIEDVVARVGRDSLPPL
jgi:hypothetical protein